MTDQELEQARKAYLRRYRIGTLLNVLVLWWLASLLVINGTGPLVYLMFPAWLIFRLAEKHLWALFLYPLVLFGLLLASWLLHTGTRCPVCGKNRGFKTGRHGMTVRERSFRSDVMSPCPHCGFDPKGRS